MLRRHLFRSASFLLLAATVMGPTGSAKACTCFHAVSENVRLVGQNYDWEADQGMVLVNPRGLRKRSFSTPNRLAWESRHASITFNQYGREFPVGGMNEQGLVITVSWLDETVYPLGDSRPTVNFLQWVQYQLDLHANVEEVLASIHDVGVANFFFTGSVHYFIADAAGNRIVLEHLGGQPTVYAGDAAWFPGLANDAYARLDLLKSLGGESALEQRGEWKGSSSRRFLRAGAHALESAAHGEPVARAFQGLADLRQQDYSKWSIVYDQRTGWIYFQTFRSPGFKRLSFADFPLHARATEALVLDINAPVEGHVAQHFAPWTPAINARITNEAFEAIDLTALIPRFARNRVINWPVEGVERPSPAAGANQPR